MVACKAGGGNSCLQNLRLRTRFILHVHVLRKRMQWDRKGWGGQLWRRPSCLQPRCREPFTLASTSTFPTSHTIACNYLQQSTGSRLPSHLRKPSHTRCCALSGTEGEGQGRECTESTAIWLTQGEAAPLLLMLCMTLRHVHIVASCIGMQASRQCTASLVHQRVCEWVFVLQWFVCMLAELASG